MIYIEQNSQAYNNDLRVMLLAFYKGERIVDAYSLEKKPELKMSVSMMLKADFKEDGVSLYIYDVVDGKQGAPVAMRMVTCDTADRQASRNPIKLALYDMLSKRTGRTLKWGTLTGIRPAKIAMKHIEEGYSDEEIVSIYERDYKTDVEKAELSVRVAHKEQELLTGLDCEHGYCLYVGIPFCPSRCLYCSFTSYPIDRYSARVDEYIDALEKELTFVADRYKDKELLSIYMGGGTPSSISEGQIDRICGIIADRFDLSHLREYTIEAGRPDSITAAKLEAMKAHGVDRISINPQTMNEKTLELIGRKHTPEDVVHVMGMARELGFENINMDIIVGLPGEDLAMTEHTMEAIREMAPDSLTVHSLAIKRAADLNINMDMYKDRMNECDIDDQLSLVSRTADLMGLAPYYLYRQKNIAGNLENVGYATPGKECLYNILIMEEKTDIIGVGAGSSCKLIRGTRIDRLENVKNVDEYIDRIDEMLDRKKALG